MDNYYKKNSSPPSVYSSAISTGGLNSFVSENDLEERRQKRQEEWEKVRKPDDPIEAPEEVYDPRSLYERLKEQRVKKQEEYEESKKLKHLIRGLDNDEVSFLEMIDNTKLELETQIWQEEMKEIDEFKKAVAHLSQEEQHNRLKEFKNEIKIRNDKKNDNNKFSKTKKSQSELLAKAIKRKSHEPNSDSKKLKTSETETETKSEEKTTESSETLKTQDENESSKSSEPTIKCIGILPGLGNYMSDDSSDSDNSSESLSEDNDFNLIVRVASKINDDNKVNPVNK